MGQAAGILQAILDRHDRRGGLRGVLTLVGSGQLLALTDLILDGLMTGIDLGAVAKIGLTLAALYALGTIMSLS